MQTTRILMRLVFAAAKSLQSYPILCDPIDGIPPGSPVPGILQARTLEWVAISFPNAWKWKVKVKSLSPVWLLATPWTAAHQAPPSMGFSMQEYWSGLPLPSLRLVFSSLLTLSEVINILWASTFLFENENNTTYFIDSCEHLMWVFKYLAHSKPSTNTK